MSFRNCLDNTVSSFHHPISYRVYLRNQEPIFEGNREEIRDPFTIEPYHDAPKRIFVLKISRAEIGEDLDVLKRAERLESWTCQLMMTREKAIVYCYKLIKKKV